MFLLPNGHKIDIEGVMDALEDTTGKTFYFLSTENGLVGCVLSSDTRGIKKLRDDKKYLEIPKVSEEVQTEWMKEFLDAILMKGDKKEKILYARLVDLVKDNKPGSFDKALSLLENSDKSLISAWVQWQGDSLFVVMITWFDTLPLKVCNQFEGCGDCGLCKLMENGDHTFGDFMEAMQREGEKGAITPLEPMSTNKDDLYYDAMDMMSERKPKVAIKILKQALELDEHSVQTHHGLSAAYYEIGDIKKYQEHTRKAFDETKKIFKEWPKEMEWGYLGNRQYLRAIFFRAGLHIEEGELEEGIKLHRLLLNMCPNDNLGVRYYLAGLYAGKTIEEVDDMQFKANKTQRRDTLEKMVATQNKKHHFWKEPKFD